MVIAIEMPRLSSTMEQGKIVNWFKKEGEEVEKGEVLFEVETDKANVEVEASNRGYLRKILVRPDVLVPVNTPIALMADSMEEDVTVPVTGTQGEAQTAPEEKPLPAQAGPIPKATPGERVKISPIALKLAKEHGIDPAILKGTGPGGRIVKEDVEQAIAAPYQDIELTKMRKVVAQRLSESKRVAPHFYIDMTVDATNINLLRTASPTDILIKLVALVLKEFPAVNASFLEDRIRVYREVNIGVAVGIEEGLVVPVVRNADQKTISQICQEVKDLVNKARNKKLLPQEYSGGTFTITNLGMFGVENFHAIINYPESAILAVGSIKPSPVVVDGRIEARPLMNLSLSVDHRVVDGVMAARFLGRVKEMIESPSQDLPSVC